MGYMAYRSASTVIVGGSMGNMANNRGENDRSAVIYGKFGIE